MNAPRCLQLTTIFVFVANGWPLSSAAAAVPLMCQAQGDYSQGVAPVFVSFHARAAAGGLPIGFQWDFGDGATSSEQNPSHAYTEVGVYDAVLTVTDSDVPRQVCRDTVVVYSGIFMDPICIATASVRWGTAPLSVGFSAFAALGPEPDTWSWWFGDGVTSAGQEPEHTYASVGTYWAVATMHTSTGGSYNCHPTLRVSAIPTDVAEVTPSARGAELRLEPARPNPFGLTTVIGWELPRPGRIRLEILDVSGRVVATLADGYRPGGRQVVVWQGRADSGPRAPAGLYFARLEHEGTVRSTRIARLP